MKTSWSLGSIILLVLFIAIPIYFVYIAWSDPFWSPFSILTVCILILIDFAVRWDIPLTMRPTFHFNDDTPAGRPLGKRQAIGGGFYMQRVLMPKWACQGAKLMQASTITGFLGLLTNYVVVQAIGYKEDFIDVSNADKSRDGGTHFLRRIDNKYPSTMPLETRQLVQSFNQEKRQWATIASSARGSNLELLRESGDNMMAVAGKLATALMQFRPPEPPSKRSVKEGEE